MYLKLVGPAIVTIGFLVAGLAAIPYYGVARLDDELRERQETLVKRNIALWVKDVEFSLTSWTVWDEAIAKLDNDFDVEWTERNIGQSLIGTSRTRFAAVLGAQDQIIYSKTADEVRNRPFFLRGPEVVVSDAKALLEDVRRQEPSVRVGRHHDPASNKIPEPLTSSRIEVLGNEAVLLTVSLFQSDFGIALPKGDRAPVLVTAMPITGSLESFFGDRFLLDDPQVTELATLPQGRAHVEIAVGNGGEAQVLSWRSPTPALDLLHQALPLITTVFLVLVSAGCFIFRASRRTIGALVMEEERMRHAATHDFLTTLPNRTLLEPEFCARVLKGPLSVICLDLDGFKKVNDNYGHAAGDELLKTVAARLRSEIKNDDVVFRLGGDEFVLFLSSTIATDAARICRRLSDVISRPIAIDGSHVIVGASFGVGEAAFGTGCFETLKLVDEALYLAKAEGRGAIVVTSSRSDSAKDHISTEPEPFRQAS
ncbi:GGDEF domain-containing protein [Oryzifoliimicrobium ureilyticus]|uniref:GGDEF domain-containing protein n=1 Tax=Oryzifoliimicrobium ureilyticus TaxID=3113724 RepID=UPI003075FD3B